MKTDNQLLAAIHKVNSTEMCGRGSLVGRSPDGQQIVVVPFFCKSWRCKVCGPRLAKVWRAKIHIAHPERFITLTWDTKNPGDRRNAYLTMKEQFPRFVRLARKKFGRFEYVLIWEFTERGWPHIHLLQKGDFIPVRWISKTWERLGCGKIVYIKDVTSSRFINRYVTKYLVKNGRETALILPSGRLVQASKHFFEPDTTSENRHRYDDWDWTHTSMSYKDVCSFLVLDCKWQFESLDEDLIWHLTRTEETKIPKHATFSEPFLAYFALNYQPGGSKDTTGETPPSASQGRGPLKTTLLPFSDDLTVRQEVARRFDLALV